MVAMAEVKISAVVAVAQDDFDNAVWPTLIFRFGPPPTFFDRSQFRTLKVIHFKDR
jgi:hypothetical protein